MTINSLKELQALIKLCKKEGVESIRVDGIEFYINASAQTRFKMAKSMPKEIKLDLPPEAELKVPQFNNKPDIIDTDELTDEQLLFYSAQDHQEQVS